MMEITRIEIDGIKIPGKVVMVFGMVDLRLDPKAARDVAHALLQQADIAELEGMRAAES